MIKLSGYLGSDGLDLLSWFDNASESLVHNGVLKTLPSLSEVQREMPLRSP